MAEQFGQWLIVGAGLIALGVFFVLRFIVGYRSRERKREQLEARADAHVADIEEESRLTFGGVVAWILLILHNLWIIQMFAGTKSTLHETTVGMFWLAGNVLWIAGILIGRRRTYRIYRVQPSTWSGADRREPPLTR